MPERRAARRSNIPIGALQTNFSHGSPLESRPPVDM